MALMRSGEINLSVMSSGIKLRHNPKRVVYKGNESIRCALDGDRRWVPKESFRRRGITAVTFETANFITLWEGYRGPACHVA
jgi:hypothetical protein